MTFVDFLLMEDGAVTIDWVVLAAGLVVLVIPLTALFSNEVQEIIVVIEAAILDSVKVTPPSGS